MTDFIEGERVLMIGDEGMVPARATVVRCIADGFYVVEFDDPQLVGAGVAAGLHSAARYASSHWMRKMPPLQQLAEAAEKQLPRADG